MDIDLTNATVQKADQLQTLYRHEDVEKTVALCAEQGAMLLEALHSDDPRDFHNYLRGLLSLRVHAEDDRFEGSRHGVYMRES